MTFNWARFTMSFNEAILDLDTYIPIIITYRGNKFVVKRLFSVLLDKVLV